MSDGSLFKNGNGAMRWERAIVVITTGLGLAISVIAILWQLFSIANAVHDQEKTNDKVSQRLVVVETGLRILDGQSQRNEDLQHRLTSAEVALNTMQMAVNGHELRVAALRADFEAQRASDQAFQTETRSSTSTFQTEMRGSISHITDIVTDVRLAIRGSGRK